jgi:hypothetical protein
MNPKLDNTDVLEVMDRVLSAALREVRAARARVPAPSLSPGSSPADSARTSNTAHAVDILRDAGRPLHVSALLAALEARGVKATRESLVSAISKKLAPLGPFVRTAPNTFGLAARDSQEV